MKIRSGPKSLKIPKTSYILLKDRIQVVYSNQTSPQILDVKHTETDTEVQKSNDQPQATPIWDRKTPRTHLHHRPAVDNSHQDPACGCQHR